MKAIELNAFGDSSNFERVERPVPVPCRGELLLRVVSSSVNPIDTKIRSGVVPAISPDLPAILHGDVAGIVEGMGEGVGGFETGQAVWACMGGFRGAPGALAEFVTVDQRLVTSAPESFPLTDAGAVPLVGQTAWLAVRKRGLVRPGQRVLVHGATGGVGHLAAQLAQLAGAEVTSTVSTAAKQASANAIGITDVILREETPENAFDLVIDTLGGPNLQKCFNQIRANGTVVTIAARTTVDLTPLHGKNATFHAVFMGLPLLTGVGREALGEILREITRLIDAGALRTLVGKRFPFEQVAEAHALLESGQHLGKIVLSGWDQAVTRLSSSVEK